MRKSQKKQILELVALLKECHEEIVELIENNCNGKAMDLLIQCQQAGIEIGTSIEKSEGEDSVTISYLEDYCELSYKIYQMVAASETLDTNEIQKLLEVSLQTIMNSIDNDIKICEEIVFLPYKASMWDSFESVWKQACESEGYEVYVIPIPYYDKSPDGKLVNEHYEASLYPDYVSVTHYNEYDFEKRRPDIIFIHNPYDEHNRITSVHPFFYAKNLKKYTKELVYIPYFVLNEFSIDDEQRLDEMKHFCTTSGVFYSNKVIVQSENIRNAYIKVLVREMGENTRSYWEKKILGIGSPKFDKIMSANKEDIEIPESWLRIIRKPDGSRKKIVLYNISIATLLVQQEKIIIKVNDVMKVFEENKEEVTLLFRPHPLMRETIKSIEAKLLSIYDNIIDTYRQGEWGIYDDTSNLYRAILMSDAYYGTYSSVETLYRMTKKPVLIENEEVLLYV